MKKILFNSKFGLEQAVLEGRKTMTRRAICPKVWDKYCEYERGYADRQQNLFGGLKDSLEYLVGLSPYKVGEVVAIAQSYKTIRDEYLDNKEFAKADTLEMSFCRSKGWNNKMFVQADLMPHHIEITKVRVEHLQDISDDDCLREGIDSSNGFEIGYGIDWVYQFPNDDRSYFTPREAFAALIDKVGKRGDFDSNPWVFVYEFKLVD